MQCKISRCLESVAMITTSQVWQILDWLECCRWPGLVSSNPGNSFSQAMRAFNVESPVSVKWRFFIRVPLGVCAMNCKQFVDTFTLLNLYTIDWIRTFRLFHHIYDQLQSANSAWSNCFWPTGHFTKTWQLAGHVDKMTTDSQDLKL